MIISQFIFVQKKFSLVLCYSDTIEKCVLWRREKNNQSQKNQLENGLKRTILRGCIQSIMNDNLMKSVKMKK